MSELRFDWPGALKNAKLNEECAKRLSMVKYHEKNR